MIKAITLDALVVYSSDTAISASVEDSQSKHPFLLTSKAVNYNLSYAAFLESCQNQGLKAGFTTSSDIIGPGKCQCYWTFSSGKWQKVNQPAQSTHIFDKVSATSPARTKERELLLSNKSIRTFNDIELFELFSDKQLTYKKLADYSIPTVSLRSPKTSSIQTALVKLSDIIDQHPHGADFSRQIVLKDRFGAGGNHVYKVDKNFAQEISEIMAENPQIRFVIQPFLAFDKGYVYKNHRVSTDIRLIIHNNKLLQCYIRMAKKTDFRCNEHQGGQLEYVTKSDIPDSVHDLAHQIIKKLQKPRSLFAIDFVISNTGRPYFLEGNIYPGLDWDVRKKANERKSKELIQSIVNSMALSIQQLKSSSKKLPLPSFPETALTSHPVSPQRFYRAS